MSAKLVLPNVNVLLLGLLEGLVPVGTLSFTSGPFGNVVPFKLSTNLQNPAASYLLP